MRDAPREAVFASAIARRSRSCGRACCTHRRPAQRLRTEPLPSPRQRRQGHHAVGEAKSAATRLIDDVEGSRAERAAPASTSRPARCTFAVRRACGRRIQAVVASRRPRGPMPHNGYRPFDITCRAAFPDFAYTSPPAASPKSAPTAADGLRLTSCALPRTKRTSSARDAKDPAVAAISAYGEMYSTARGPVLRRT